ncbi:hypothetical protein C0J52_22279 [Blattella germanica]|nr:hypothetical protein C0J52_22279 [Blattella germanica]
MSFFVQNKSIKKQARHVYFSKPSAFFKNLPVTVNTRSRQQFQAVVITEDDDDDDDDDNDDDEHI